MSKSKTPEPKKPKKLKFDITQSDPDISEYETEDRWEKNSDIENTILEKSPMRLDPEKFIITKNETPIASHPT